MITPAYSPTATERVLPRLALDFTTGVLDPRVTVTRALDTATRVNSSGYIENVNADLPRFDYDPVTFAPKGLLIEETRANFLTFSEQFNNAAWSTLRGAIAPDATLAPNGQVVADKFTEDNTTNTRGTQQSVTITAGATHTASVYLSNIDRRYVSLIVANSATGLNAFVATFDLQNGTSTTQIRGSGTVASARMVSSGNGFYRCIVTGTIPDAGAIVIVSPATTATPTMGSYGRESYQGDGVKAFYFWGAQLEAGAFATSYIPTTTTSLTRNADVVQMTGTNFTDWWSATQGTFVAGWSVNNVDTSGRRYAWYINEVGNTRLTQRAVDNSINYPIAVVGTGVGNVNLNGAAYAANTPIKVAVAYGSNMALSQNGAAPATNATAASVTGTLLAIGSNTTAAFLNGHVQFLDFYVPRVINAQTQAFSK